MILSDHSARAKQVRGSDQIPLYYSDSRDNLYEFATASGLSAVGRTLVVGCAGGSDAANLRGLGATQLVGIEPVSGAAKVARSSYDIVFAGSLEEYVWDGLPFGLVVFADVLEHLIDPYSALATCHEWLSTAGRVLISIPNIRHLSVLVPLIVAGEWHYREAGILDATHLRFFTSRSFRRLLSATGYETAIVQRWGAQPVTRSIARVLPAAGEFLLSQVFIIARPVERCRDFEEPGAIPISPSDPKSRVSWDQVRGFGAPGVVDREQALKLTT